jgi:hypothetical protein
MYRSSKPYLNICQDERYPDEPLSEPLMRGIRGNALDFYVPLRAFLHLMLSRNHQDGRSGIRFEATNVLLRPSCHVV